MGKKSREKQERRLEAKKQIKPSSQRLFGLEKIYFSIIEFGTYLLLFTPFIFIRDYFFPFVVPKTIFFRIIVDIIFIAYILLVVSNPKYRPRFNALTIGITIFLGILILTSFTGINFEKSFWSVFERMTGLITFFHLFALFIILSSVFKERKYWERIFTVSILVGVFISFYALTSGEASTRGGGTLGNTSFFSAYMLFNIFFAIILLFAKKGWWKICYGLSLVIMLSAFFFNTEPTHGAIGPFFGGLFLLGLGFMVFSGKKLLKRLAPIVLIFVVLVGIGLAQTNFFKERIIDLEDVPGRDRELVWQMAFEGWQERPWLGWGQENFNIPFVKYFDAELPLTRDVWYDRAHNIVLDIGVTSGILGLISYLAIFGIAIFGLLRVCSKVIERKNLIFPLGMISLLAVYFAQNIWVFDMISSYVVFFLSLAFINFLIQKEDNISSTSSTSLVNPKINLLYAFFGVSLILVTIFTIYYGNIRPAQASRFTVQGISFPLEYSMPAFQKALDISPMSKFEVPEQLSKKIIDLAFQPNQNKELLNKGFKLAEEELRKSIDQNPLDYRLQLFLGKYYNNLYQVTKNKEVLDLSEEWLEKAIKLSPHNQQTYWSLAQTRLFQGKYKEAITLLQKAVDLEPRFPQSHWYLASTYRMVKEYELALAELKEAENLGYNWQGNLLDLKQVIEIYKALGDHNTSASLYEIAVELSPKDVQLWVELADTYAILGEREKAKLAAQMVLELKPELATQTEQFLKELGY